MQPIYTLPWKIVPGLAADLLLGRRRSLRADAAKCVARLKPNLQVFGEEFIPKGGSCLVTVNHYTRPGLPAWWMVLAASACMPAEIHWIMTSAWTYPDPLRARLVTPLTRVFFKRLAQIYEFTNMPPMPPDPGEVEARAQAVRRVLEYARRSVNPVIGLAPEGRDAPKGLQGTLVEPPPGVGRFVLQLTRLGLQISPVGVFEADGRLCIRFGQAYGPDTPQGLNAEERDRQASREVMLRIANLLPSELRAGYRS